MMEQKKKANGVLSSMLRDLCSLRDLGAMLSVDRRREAFSKRFF
jgi:hypothetical protein